MVTEEDIKKVLSSAEVYSLNRDSIYILFIDRQSISRVDMMALQSTLYSAGIKAAFVYCYEAKKACSLIQLKQEEGK